MEIESDELKIRVKLLETVFKSKNLYSSDDKSDTDKVCKKTVEKWFAGKSKPTERTLQKLCGAAGITVAECFAPFEELPKILAEKGGHDYTEDQIRGEIQRLSGEKPETESKIQGEGLMAVLSEIIKSISKADLKKAFRIYKGYYYAYMKWFHWDKSEYLHEPKISLYRFLIKIDEIDEKSNIIKTKLTTRRQLKELKEKKYEEKWPYQGVVISVGDSLYFIFEHIFEPIIHSGYVFMITRNKPVSHLLGLLTAETGGDRRMRFQRHYESFPTSTRIMLMKISDEDIAKGEDYLMEQMGYYEPHELKEIGPELLEDMNRESKNGIFTAF